jgi:hypothetical protein
MPPGTRKDLSWRLYLSLRDVDDAYTVSRNPTSLMWISSGVTRMIGPDRGNCDQSRST